MNVATIYMINYIKKKRYIFPIMFIFPCIIITPSIHVDNPEM